MIRPALPDAGAPWALENHGLHRRTVPLRHDRADDAGWSHDPGTLHFLGNTDIALMLATLMSFYVLGVARGFSMETILRFTNECLAPTALIMLLIGAGGGFGRVLVDSGVSKVITDAALGVHMPLLVLAWVLAVIVRIACGSATVSMATASGIVAPILEHSSGVSPELMVLVTGAGSVAFGLMNDAAFW